MVQVGVDLTKSGLDGIGVWCWAAWGGVHSQRGERSEKTRAQLDEQHAELEAQRSEAIAAAGAHALDQAFSAELAEVVAQLAESVVGLRELMAGQDAGMQFAGGPVADKASRLKHGLQQADQPVVMQLQSGDASVPDHGRLGQRGQLPGVDRTGQ